jgi:hypothetical protein
MRLFVQAEKAHRAARRLVPSGAMLVPSGSSIAPLFHKRLSAAIIMAWLIVSLAPGRTRYRFCVSRAVFCCLSRAVFCLFGAITRSILCVAHVWCCRAEAIFNPVFRDMRPLTESLIQQSKATVSPTEITAPQKSPHDLLLFELQTEGKRSAIPWLIQCVARSLKEDFDLGDHGALILFSNGLSHLLPPRFLLALPLFESDIKKNVLEMN